MKRNILYDDSRPSSYTSNFSKDFLDKLGKVTWRFEVVSYGKTANNIHIYIVGEDNGLEKEVVSFEIMKRFRNSIKKI